MKNLAKLLTAFIIIVIIGCSDQNINKREPIKIGINVWPGTAYAFIAVEKGLFEKNKVDVELVLKKDVSESTYLYKTGDVDGLFGVFSDVIMLNAEGIETKVVCVCDYSNEGDVIIGRPEFSPETLKGKTISFEGVNSFSHLFVLQALNKLGLKETDSRFVNIEAMDVLTALDENMIDAGHTWEPVTSRALAKGYKILYKAGNIPGLITDLLVFNNEIIERRPDDVLAIVKSLFEAKKFISSNREEALTIMAQAEWMSVEEMDAGLKAVNFLDLESNAIAFDKSTDTESLFGSGKIISEFFLNRGQLSSIPDLDKIIEPEFITTLIGEE